jgi:hypothetical protein
VAQVAAKNGRLPETLRKKPVRRGTSLGR